MQGEFRGIVGSEGKVEVYGSKLMWIYGNCTLTCSVVQKLTREQIILRSPIKLQTADYIFSVKTERIVENFLTIEERRLSKGTI